MYGHAEMIHGLLQIAESRQQDQANTDRMRAENLKRTDILRHPITVNDFGGDVKAFVTWRQSKDFPVGWDERDAKL